MISKIKSLFYYCFVYPVYKIQFGSFGYKSRIKSPLRIDGRKNIFIKDNVLISNQTWLASMPLTESENCRLLFERNCVIGNFNHIYCTGEIHFEAGVLTADKVYISDNLHEYKDIETHIYKQPIRQLKKMVIGEGSWIGENACIIGASIGKQSVVGANTVVTKDVPDYSVVVGAPAKIIKKFCFEDRVWKNTDTFGNFLKSE